MSHISDLELLGACRAGERDAFGRFYERHRAIVVGYLARRVASPELAADLMAETFASALVATLDDARALPDRPVAWLFTIARNLLVDSLRRGQVEATARRRLGLGSLELDDHDIDRIGEITAATDLLRDLAPSLSADEWDVLCARVIDEEPYAQLAQRLRCSEAVVRKRVSRAKAQLRTALGEKHA